MASVVEILVRAKDQYSASLKKADKNMRSIVATGTALTGVGLAVTGALVKMAQESAELGDQFQKASIKTGASTEALSSLKFAAEQSGASYETLEKALIKVAANSAKAAEGTKTQADAFDALGVKVTDANGQLRPTNDLLLASADRFAYMTNETEKAALAQDIFGKSGVDLIPLLNQGRDGIKELTDQASELGVVYSQDLANDSADLLDAQNELKSAFSGISREVSETVIPVMTQVIDTITPWIIKTNNLVDAHPGLIKMVGALAVGLVGPGGLLLGFAGVLKLLPLVKVGLAGVGGPITPLVILIGALSANLFAMRTELASVVLFIQSKVLGALSKMVSTLNSLPKAINPFANQLGNLERKLASMAQEADDTSNALLQGKDAMEENRRAAEELERTSADLARDGIEVVTEAVEENRRAAEELEWTSADLARDGIEVVTEAVKDETAAIEDAFGVISRDYNVALFEAEQNMINAATAAADLSIATLDLGHDLDAIPEPPSIFDQEWAKPQIQTADGMLDGFEQHTKDTVDAIITEAERQKSEQVRLSDEAAKEYETTFTGIQTAFGTTFQSMVTSGKFEIDTIKDYFLNTFSSIFFEQILGGGVAHFITPFVNEMKDKLIDVFSNLFTKTATNIGSDVASNAASNAISGAISGGAAAGGGGAAAGAGLILAVADTFVSAFAGRGRAQRTEENTREARDWLELQTVAWNPLFHQIAWHHENTIKPALMDLGTWSTVMVNEVGQPTLAAVERGVKAQENIGERTISLLQAISEGIRAGSRQEIVLNGDVLGVTIAGALNQFVTQEGGRLVASETS